MKWLPVVLLAAGLAACSAESSAEDISADSLLLRASGDDPPLVLDVRSEDEYARGYVPGAINIPYDQLPARLAELGAQPGDEVVVYCESGRRASIAAGTLREAGFTVLHLDGDMKGWRAAGRTLEK